MVQFYSSYIEINTMTEQNWEKETLEKLIYASLKEQRRNRRWGIFFKLAFVIFLIWFFMPSDLDLQNRTKPHTALIDIRGEITDTTLAAADNIATSLDMAFKDNNVQGIIIRINSPGGSPVQASYVYDEIIRQRKLHPKVKVYAVCTDVCASAAYYIAAATDQIYANPSSIVGSIGVLMDSFGFVDAMNKVGIQRRLLTSGVHKGFLDPFSPVKPDEEQYARTMLNEVHQQFISDIKKNRGKRLKDDPDLFSGLAWTGQQSLALGLIDGFGSAGYVAREVIKNDNTVDYTIKPNYIDLIVNKIGAAFAHELSSELRLRNNALH